MHVLLCLTMHVLLFCLTVHVFLFCQSVHIFLFCLPVHILLACPSKDQLHPMISLETRNKRHNRILKVLSQITHSMSMSKSQPNYRCIGRSTSSTTLNRMRFSNVSG